MKKLFKLTVFAGALAGGWKLWKRRMRTIDQLRNSGWFTRRSESLNSVELPPTSTARSQHEQPMRRSEETVDEAHTAKL